MRVAHGGMLALEALAVETMDAALHCVRRPLITACIITGVVGTHLPGALLVGAGIHPASSGQRTNVDNA